MGRCSRRRRRTDSKRGDVYLVTLDPTSGRGQRGFRPVVVISPERFNATTRLPVTLPITNGGAFAAWIGFAVPITGITTTGVVRCDRPRVVDLAARGARKLDAPPEDILDEVMARVVTLFE